MSFWNRKSINPSDDAIGNGLGCLLLMGCGAFALVGFVIATVWKAWSKQ